MDFLSKNDLIISLYNENKTTREIAVEVGCSKTLVGTIILKAGISRKRRPRNHVLANRANKCLEFDNSFINYLDGLVISDGSLVKPKKYAGGTCYKQTCVKREWLEIIQEKFKKYEIQSCIREDIRIGRKIAFVLVTKSYDQFLKQYYRWYNNEIKKVPQDISLKDIDLLKNWVYGDGTRVGTSLRFCCDSFCLEDIDLLLCKFKELDYMFKIVDMGLSKKGYSKLRLSICQKNGLERFLEFLGEPINCFKYKWSL